MDSHVSKTWHVEKLSLQLESHYVAIYSIICDAIVYIGCDNVVCTQNVD